MPYLLSFVVRAEGTLLDGTRVSEAIARIDDSARPAPNGYLCNCVHPENFAKALEAAENERPGVRNRLIGLQGNTSRKDPAQLDGAAKLEGEDPVPFGAAMASLRQRFGTHILGGCCGTDVRHIAAIAEQLQSTAR